MKTCLNMKAIVASLLSIAILVAMPWFKFRPYTEVPNFASQQAVSGKDFPRWTHAAKLTIQHANAWAARQSMERQLNAVRKLVLTWGGTVILRDVRYIYAKPRKLKTDTEFTIIYHVDIVVPVSVDRFELERQLAKLGLAD